MLIEVYKSTKDEWCPSLHLKSGKGLVRVSLTQTGPDPKNFKGEFRVCVWGADDCGMERDFENREAEALNTFMQVIGLPNVNFQDLKQLGFVSA